MGVNDYFKNFIIFGLIYLFVVWFDSIYINQEVPKGVYGLMGPTGNIGNTGSDGSKGLYNSHKYFIDKITYNKIGPVGPKGESGSIGPPGPDGFRGIEGPMGPDGAAGPVGQQGDMGLQGIQGESGTNIDWYLSNVNKKNCVDGIYNEIGDSMCPEKTVMIGIQNIVGTENTKLKCCYLTANVEVQQEKYKILRKGERVNSINFSEY